MTVYKIMGRNRFVRAKRLPSGHIVYKNKIIDPRHQTFVEKEALSKFSFIVRFNEAQEVIQLPFFNRVKMQPRQKKKIITQFVDHRQELWYISSDLLCFEANRVTRVTDKRIFMARIVVSGGVLVKERPEKLSRNIGTIRADATILIESVELSFTECLEFVRLYKDRGYIYKNTVRLLGYADDKTIERYEPVLDPFPIFFHHEKKCIICLDRPCDAVFVHNDTGHNVCCYTCARGCGSTCPVCRQRIEKTLLVFT